MNFAKFWKEAVISVDKKFFGMTEVSVWGASNISLEEAGKNAEARATRFKEIINSDKLTLQDYEYWNGYIREEVVEEVQSSDGRVLAVLTRNNYGALVLNSESVFFGDIDVVESGFVTRILEWLGKTKKDKVYYIEKVEAFQKENPKYTVKVYETFAGLRIAITNQTFDSNSNDTNAIFLALDTDPLYVKLCKGQSCFRARLSPKPWRVGIDRPETRFPRELQSEKDGFNSWLEKYQTASSTFSSAKHLKTFGSGMWDSDVDRVLFVHDQYACTASAALA